MDFMLRNDTDDIAVAILQLKHGEIHTTVYAAAVLTGNEQPLEVQMSAYTLLQHLVRESHPWRPAPSSCQLAMVKRLALVLMLL
jgi:hypothetical protein